ncbi:CBS domain-containing protein [Lutibacter sp. B2]|nr:CBS domain-containing protein [Lutibacter sp. B2]
MKVKDLMTNQVASATPDTSLEQLANKMKELNVGSIPICDSNNVAVGVVTDRDIVLKGVSVGNMSASAKDVMSKNIVSATPDMDAHEAANIMAQNQIRRLPVMENGKMVGILSIGDLSTVNIYENEAGQALSSISQPTK